MKKRLLNNLQIVKCRKCGKEITTLVNPIYSTKEVQDEYAGLCSDCISQKDYFKMLYKQGECIAKGGK
jgi:hypothetical protein